MLLDLSKTFFPFFNALVLGCPFPAKIDHSATGQVWFSDGHCSSFQLKIVKMDKIAF
jgi:hypothetical protein